MGVIFAFGLTLLAGLSTGIGSLIALLTKKTNNKFLEISLGFSGGVMIYVSLVEIYQDARISLVSFYGDTLGKWITVLAFFGGMLLIGIIDKIIPSPENPHEIKKVEDMDKNSESCNTSRSNLMRMGLFTAVALALHNFPEGIANFMSAMQDTTIAIPIAFAIAIHNIPEGIAVSVPIFYATGSRKKAFVYSFASGLTEPLGAIIGYTLLRPFMSEGVLGIVFSMVAGIMIFISLDELLPAAREYGEHHLSIYGMVAGMAVMAISLLLF